MDNKQREYNDVRNYMFGKFGSDFMSAIAKLNSPNQYDEKGLLRSECYLTDKEKNALMYCVPELSEVIYSSEEDFERHNRI